MPSVVVGVIAESGGTGGTSESLHEVRVFFDCVLEWRTDVNGH